ncbi:MAG TPA: hypothetical protein VK866_15105 [Acidimicrobiales bacterium]|nr:hypothetical protein [Acidimicrobiales bacterium]
MSIRVEPDELAAALAERTFPPFLVTVGPEGGAHLVAVAVTLADGDLVVHGAGRTTLANLGLRSEVTLAWAPPEPDGYSMIVDGVAHAEGDALRVVVTSAVLHRPAPTPPSPPSR